MGGDDAANKAILNEITILVSLITQFYANLLMPFVQI